ncbi:MAG: aminotransferase class V-fold PLP-dependent enzyme, partial [Actinomycetes bacterium]
TEIKKLDVSPAIAIITGLKGTFNTQEGVFKVTLPRNDVKITVDGWAMPPFMGGGDMIRTVTREGATWNDLPFKFEAGTPPFVQATALAAAFDWIDEIGIDEIRAHEHGLVEQTLSAFSQMGDIKVFGPASADDRGALVTFAVDGVHPHDVAEILGRAGVCVRAGHHCAGPLMDELGVSSTTRASFAVHNSSEDVDRLVAALGDVRRIFGD